MNRWTPVTTSDRAPELGEWLEFALTASEKSHAAVISTQVERQRRDRNAADKARQDKADRAEAARMGITWEGV